jgi:hypothetical protein
MREAVQIDLAFVGNTTAIASALSVWATARGAAAMTEPSVTRGIVDAAHRRSRRVNDAKRD